MNYKLGFSKHPDKYTHFKFESLYNKHMITESKRVLDQDKVFLNLTEDKIPYHLSFDDEQFIFKADKKQDLVVTKLTNEMGTEQNYIQQQLKYVYLRNGQKNEFLLPVFDNEFTEHKLEYIGVKKLHETTGLRWELVWKCIVNPDNKATFVHAKTGVILSFDGKENIEGSTEFRSSPDEDHQKKIKDGHFGLNICPITSDQSVTNTLIKEADFRIQQNIDGSQCYVKSYQEKLEEGSDKVKFNEYSYIDPPLLQNQEYFTDAFGKY